jgi:protein-L-isoaspartate(D-aspartate) O-methyltransferase
VLDVGTGSGYHTAVLARIAQHVWTIERIAALATEARERFRRLGLVNITSLVGDGATGHPGAAPYDAILSAAAAPRPPQPLIDQLAVGGRLVLPVGDRAMQELTVLRRTREGLDEERVGAVRFVPLVSPEGFTDEDG